MNNTLIIRPASPDDAGRLVEIYRPYVETTAITFEYVTPSEEEFRERMSRTLKKYSYLVAELDGRVSGYTYAGPFVGRAAYDWSVETTIYLEQSARRCGIGGRLYSALEDALRSMGILNLNACIAVPEKDDEYLTRNSVEFHTHLGYKWVGEFHSCGYKFGRWYNMAWMEKFIGEHTGDPSPVTPFPRISRP